MPKRLTPFSKEPVHAKVTVSTSEESRKDIVAAVRGDDALLASVHSADVLIVPSPGHSGYDAPVFPQGTLELLHHLRDKLPQAVRVEIAIDDADYEELTLHAAEIILPTISVLTVFGNVLLNVVGNYLYDLFKGDASRERARVRAKVVVHEEHRSVAIEYDGPAHEFQAVTERALAEAQRDVAPRIRATASIADDVRSTAMTVSSRPPKERSTKGRKARKLRKGKRR